ncbi:MAG: cell filamentation protein Fic [Elusimicrobia bacterium]|nr:MAG: cell filamentation protein Fic [Elusimicrobiota bacterium]
MRKKKKVGQKAPPGRWVRCPRGVRAYVPNPLPPKLIWSPRLVRALSDADRMIGRLAGEGRRLLNPHLLMRPFIRREAVLSSRIEGTQATLGELLEAEAGGAVERSPDDLREVGNYVAALEYGMKRLKKLPLSLRLVRELHARLMKGVRGDRATPGAFRRSQNWIGTPGCTLNDASYIPPPPTELMDCLGSWEEFLHEGSMPALVQAGLAHYQFEAIHPFLDGNGRVGRLMITLFLVEREILPTPLLYLSAFFEATRRDYYDLLAGVSERGDWETWLIYFLNGVARQSEDAFGRAERINGLLERWRMEVSRISFGRPTEVPRRLVDLLAANPFITIKRAAKQLRVAFTTAQRGMDKLEKLGIVARTTRAKRDRVYSAQGILNILEEPTRITPLASKRRAGRKN